MTPPTHPAAPPACPACGAPHGRGDVAREQGRGDEGSEGMKYIVNVSSGLASAEALERTIVRAGKENTIGVFADVKGYSTSEHAGEDADNYRFLADIEHFFDLPIVRVVEGRDIWQAMFDARAITLPNNSRAAPCSRMLKRAPIDRWIAERYTPDECIRVVGLDWSEPHRIADFEAAVLPYRAWFPLNEAPYMDKCHITDKWQGRGIQPPALYEVGFSHANCGGFCVKAGQAHFALLYRANKERYLYHAEKEAQFQREINPKATILNDRRGGTRRGMTLYEFAERLERGEAYEADEWGGCGCFAPNAQERMSEIFLEVQPDTRPRPAAPARAQPSAAPVVAEQGDMFSEAA